MPVSCVPLYQCPKTAHLSTGAMGPCWQTALSHHRNRSFVLHLSHNPTLTLTSWDLTQRDPNTQWSSSSATHLRFQRKDLYLLWLSCKKWIVGWVRLEKKSCRGQEECLLTTLNKIQLLKQSICVRFCGALWDFTADWNIQELNDSLWWGHNSPYFNS